jgi:hypothetical protein
VQRCSSCGEESPDRFLLGGYCGSVLVALASSQEVRKTVTVVFCNLKGSTELAGRLDSEASGVGRECGEHWYEHYTEQKAMMIQL